MIKIDNNFTGGNIEIIGIEGDTVTVERELRDTFSNWFYWAFRVRGAEGKTITFRFTSPNRVGYYGAAVSHDLKKWEWSNTRFTSEGVDGFTYEFAQDETEVYFSHNMLYSPMRFNAFMDEQGVEVKELCRTAKGRSLPFVTVGEGDKTILLTARHHACENTGSYVLEGVMSELIKNPLKGYKVICIPFVDYDGVVDGDQGKERAPYDHNRDYDPNKESLYPACKAIRKIADEGVELAFDFHSPWHIGGSNDKAFLVYSTYEMQPRLKELSKCITESMTTDAFPYSASSDHPVGLTWNDPSHPTKSRYVARHEKNILACSVETAYFGEKGVSTISQDNMVAFGKCFANAIRRYTEKEKA